MIARAGGCPFAWPAVSLFRETTGHSHRGIAAMLRSCSLELGRVGLLCKGWGNGTGAFANIMIRQSPLQAKVLAERFACEVFWQMP